MFEYRSSSTSLLLVKIEKYWINPAQITSICPYEPGAKIFFVGEDYVRVDMSPDEVAAHIEKVCKEPRP